MTLRITVLSRGGLAVHGGTYDAQTNRAKTDTDLQQAVEMSDPLTREELAAELRATKAEATSQFKEILGEIRTSNAELAGKIELASSKAAGKWTVWGAAGTIVVAIISILIALSQVAQTGYDAGAEGWAATGLDKKAERESFPAATDFLPATP